MDESKSIAYTFRLPRELKDAMVADAEKHSRSINAHFVEVLRAYFAGELIPAEKLLTEPSVRHLLQAAVDLDRRLREGGAAAGKTATEPLLSVAPRKTGKKPGKKTGRG